MGCIMSGRVFRIFHICLQVDMHAKTVALLNDLLKSNGLQNRLTWPSNSDGAQALILPDIEKSRKLQSYLTSLGIT